MGFLSNGIDGGSALDLTHIKGGAAIFRDWNPVQQGNHFRQLLDRIIAAKIIERMAALGADGNAKTLGTHRLIYELIQLTVKGAESADLVSILFTYLTDAL